jgi:hypothetical protein
MTGYRTFFLTLNDSTADPNFNFEIDTKPEIQIFYEDDKYYGTSVIFKVIFFSLQCHHMSLTDFVVSPPGCGRSVTDF